MGNNSSNEKTLEPEEMTSENCAFILACAQYTNCLLNASSAWSFEHANRYAIDYIKTGFFDWPCEECEIIKYSY